MRLDPYKYKITELYNEPGWNERRIQLLNEWCRASLRKQTNQNFIFVSLWQSGQMADGGELDNEIKIEIEHTGTIDDEPLDYDALINGKVGKKTLNFADQIRDKIRKLFKAPLLVTNLDADDALHFQFVEKLQQTVSERDFDRTNPFYFSTSNRYCYNIRTGKKGMKKTASPSPSVSTWEPYINCFPLRYNHQYLGQWVPGVNVEGLIGLQTVNDTNMFSRKVGEFTEFDLEDYV